MEIGWEGRQREELQKTARLLPLVMGWVDVSFAKMGRREDGQVCRMEVEVGRN